MVAVSIVAEGRMRLIDDDSELSEVLDTVFATPQGRGWTLSMVAWRTRGPEDRMGRAANHRLRVSTEPMSGWGALNFLHLRLDGRTWHSWNTFNPEPDSDAPLLPFGRNGLVFPRNAALPLWIVHKAAAEYGHAAARPVEVQWQDADYV